MTIGIYQSPSSIVSLALEEVLIGLEILARCVTSYLTQYSQLSLRQCQLIGDKNAKEYYIVFKMEKGSADRSGSVAWASSCKVKGHRFNSWPGHLPGLRVWFPGEGAQERQLIEIFLSLSPSLPLSLKNKQINKYLRVRETPSQRLPGSQDGNFFYQLDVLTMIPTQMAT